MTLYIQSCIRYFVILYFVCATYSEQTIFLFFYIYLTKKIRRKINFGTRAGLLYYLVRVPATPGAQLLPLQPPQTTLAPKHSLGTCNNSTRPNAYSVRKLLPVLSCRHCTIKVPFYSGITIGRGYRVIFIQLAFYLFLFSQKGVASGAEVLPLQSTQLWETFLVANESQTTFWIYFIQSERSCIGGSAFAILAPKLYRYPFQWPNIGRPQFEEELPQLMWYAYWQSLERYDAQLSPLKPPPPPTNPFSLCYRRGRKTLFAMQLYFVLAVTPTPGHLQSTFLSLLQEGQENILCHVVIFCISCHSYSRTSPINNRRTLEAGPSLPSHRKQPVGAITLLRQPC